MWLRRLSSYSEDRNGAIEPRLIRQGVLYAALGRLDVGVELADGKRDWKILRPRKWFENYPAFE